MSADSPRFDRPLFIIAAPRSGSTLLFETLAASEGLATLGGEAPWLIEGVPALRPGAPNVDSNRLTSEHASPAIVAHIREAIAARLLGPQGRPGVDPRTLRLLEKTPRNALRVPFLDAAFPDARFIFLWRDPRENLSSIIEAWRAGRWRTYPSLVGFALPWSLLLPPGWQALRGKPLEEIAAYQWETTNRIALEDLAAVPANRWTSLAYDELVAEPAMTLRRLCAFADIRLDAGLIARVSLPLPLARHTLTPPAVGKWRHNADAIDRVLPSVAATWARLRTLAAGAPAIPSAAMRHEG
jgi:hypothetical protein